MRTAKLRPHFACYTPEYTEIEITQECGCVGFNGPDGRQGCVLTRTVESNQGSRLDGNESVADSFRSDLVGFKSCSARILGAFLPSYVCQKKPPVEKRTRYPPSLLFSTDKYHPCNI
ncbi:hypothetical protein TNCV_3107561 [Trichonephila clavipes]|uniref:Uncharacterized protein n=1 Tax=Trichonephila clavipes TaxID=2585209 RepID=A0A8X6S240_TRICX|nr:hypothetical protein TNCV_3107561 [Trichonephila clavipes]